VIVDVFTKGIMAWRTPEDKKRFFDDLDRAFKTPASEPLILPRVSHMQDEAEVTPTGTKRPASSGGDSADKRRRTSATENSLTGVGVRVPKKSLKVKGTSRTKRRNTTKTETSELKSTLLQGMTLFFIPNSKKNGVRKFRMTLFAQHGADVRDAWSSEVTHIICDCNITGERIMRDLGWEQIPVLRCAMRLT
jgi:BRCA1 C Terminus (BRCT) domain